MPLSSRTASSERGTPCIVVFITHEKKKNQEARNILMIDVPIVVIVVEFKAIGVGSVKRVSDKENP